MAAPSVRAFATESPGKVLVDFRRSLPPVPNSLHVHVRSAFDAIADSGDLGRLMHQSVPRGADEDRIAGAKFLALRFKEPIAPSRVVVTNGTQSAIQILLRRLIGTGGVLVAERLSYGPLRMLAELAGVRAVGLDIDADGILPASFADACRTLKPKALYCNPTVQNPTTAIMPEERRIAIAEIARRHGVAIIEDDALGRLHLDAARPIAALAPDITWYVMTTTKCLAHGLRLAYMVTPTAGRADQVLEPIEHLSFWHPAPLLASTVTRWIHSGAADEISLWIHRECVARERAAQKILNGFDVQHKSGSMHIWLALPDRWNGREFAHAMERRGVLLRSSELFAVDDQPTPNCVRLSLSTPDDIEDVRRGLHAVRLALDGEFERQDRLAQ
jgi:DNA-binding transcriptional MocR family regulator